MRGVDPVSWPGILLVCRLMVNPSSSHSRRAGNPRTFHRSGIDNRRFDRDRIGPRSTHAIKPVRSRRPYAAIQPSRFPLPCDESSHYSGRLITASELTGSDVSLQRFMFPFSGPAVEFVFRGDDGIHSIRSATRERLMSIRTVNLTAESLPPLDDSTVSLMWAGILGARSPAISIFLKPRMSGPRHIRELADRVVITLGSHRSIRKSPWTSPGSPRPICSRRSCIAMAQSRCRTRRWQRRTASSGFIHFCRRVSAFNPYTVPSDRGQRSVRRRV